MALSVGISTSASHASSATTASVTTTSGSAIEVVVTGSTSTLPTISDSKGNVWTQIGSRVQFNSYPGSIWHFKNESGTRGSSHTFTAAGTDISIMVQEIIGTTPVVDVHAGGTDSSTPFDSDLVTPTVADFLLVAGIGCDAGASTNNFPAGNGFTQRCLIPDATSYWPGALGTRVVTGGSGSYQSSWTNAYSLTGAGHSITAWKESGGGGSPSVPDQLLNMPPMRAARR